MNDPDSKPDADNPRFEFDSARPWQQGDPASTEAAKLRRALRAIVAAAERRDVDACHELAREALQ